MSDNAIVLIADIKRDDSSIDIHSKDLECLSESYFEDVFYALKTITDKVVHYETPKDFLDHITEHRNDIILPLWSGEMSLNRKVLIPSICEAYGLPYIGADPYVHFTCQDKALSKHICKRYGINVAAGVTIWNKDEISAVRKLNLPIVVKPNFEGGSIGISQKNVTFSYADAEALAEFLLVECQQAIIAEEYIEGHEICVSIAGKNNRIDVMEADEIVYDDPREKYPMFGFEAKKAKTVASHKKSATHYLSVDIKGNFKKLFFDLGKVDVMRIDGKILDGRFTLIELSPDTNLSRTASTAFAFDSAGYKYEEMFRLLLSYQEQEK